ncbi:MAG: DEAD/DEAH box helicase [Gemmatimonadaceae bacterium]|nr:DEAD/DEAH box helicase [Gemmatimonadaceae bacterium]
MTATTRCVEVALPVPLFRTFTYLVPEGIAMPIPAGSRLLVPFRARREVGICLGPAVPPEGVTLKAIHSVLDSEPAIPPALLDTGRWIAEWYAAPIGMTLRAMLPASLTTSRGVDSAPKRRRVACIALELPSLLQRETTFARAKQQRVVYELLEAQGGVAVVETLRQQANCSAGVVAAMIKRGLIEVRDESVARDPFADRAGVAPPATPSAAQRAVVNAILSGAPGQTFLLHGITGSGKTLVYIEVLRAVLAQPGRTAIVLVPEIALTSQTVDRFRGAFGDAVAVLHSGLSDGERHDAWQSLRRGERRIAVGARSALFAPLSQVGVVIVDEEHESSYKQSETPRYHAREAAIVRARRRRNSGAGKRHPESGELGTRGARAGHSPVTARSCRRCAVAAGAGGRLAGGHARRGGRQDTPCAIRSIDGRAQSGAECRHRVATGAWGAEPVAAESTRLCGVRAVPRLR